MTAAAPRPRKRAGTRVTTYDRSRIEPYQNLGNLRGDEIGLVARRQHAGAPVSAGNCEDQREHRVKGHPGRFGPRAVDLVVSAIVHTDHARARARRHAKGSEEGGRVNGWEGTRVRG